ncbi:MAG: type III-A CRISPR-associated RAMP protein Csm5 [bacterium]
MLKVKRFQLLPLSPIHIGGRFQALYPFEYVVSDGRFIVVRETKLGEFLQRRGLLMDFLRRFEQAGFSLTEYLREKGLLSSFLLDELSLYSCRLSCRPPEGKQVRPFTRDAFQRPYIPGSALKGAMRTALWYDAMTRNRDLLGKVRSALEDKKIREKAKDDELDKDIFEGYRLRDMCRSPHTDLLRVIKVSDSQPWEKDSLFLGEEETLAGGKPRPDISTFLEFVKEAMETEFQITFDEELFARFQEAGNLLFNGFDDFLSKVDSFYRKVAEEERKEGEEKAKGFYDWLLDKTKGKGTLLRIGWGGGLPSLTIWLALPNDLKAMVRTRFFSRSHREKFPLTRRFLKRKEGEEDNYTPFGWVLIREVR